MLLTLPFLPWACTGPQPPTPGTAKIYLDEQGIYRLTQPALREAGLELTGVDPSLLRLTLRGQEVPMRVISDGAAIEFYGTANDSEYSATNVYWLTAGLEKGKRMEERTVSSAEGASFPASFEATLHLEQDALYWAKAAEGTERWYWQALTAPATVTLSFNLPHLAGAEGVLRVALLGGTSDAAQPDHHVRILLNDQLAADATWDGQETFVVEAPTSHLLEGQNKLSLEAAGDTAAKADVVLLDWVEIRYPRRFVADEDHLQFEGQAGGYRIAGFSQSEVEVFDISDPANPVHLSGVVVEPDGDTYTVCFFDPALGQRTYVAVSSGAIKVPTRIVRYSGPSGLGGTAGKQADYIIITHPDFRQSVQPLVEWRQGQGLAVKVATIEEVYDEFSYGLANPAAIRDFLRHAHQHWAKPAPRYVLLVGDASYDYRDNLQAPNKNLVPTYLVQTHFVGETASDNWFVDFDDDGSPDMAIGRLPVKSAAEVQIVMDKTIGYERNTALGEWRKRVLFVADDDQAVFEATSDDLAENYIPPDFQAAKVYLSDLADPGQSKARIIEAINQGAVIVSYVGHAALNVWAKEAVFSSLDIASLQNGSKLPFVVTMTCLDGYFHHPQADCLAEQLLLTEGKGAVAVLAPTSESLPSDQDVLAKALFQALFAEDAPTVGEAIMRAKRSLPDGGHGYEDLIETYILFGDPALRLAQP